MFRFSVAVTLSLLSYEISLANSLSFEECTKLNTGGFKKITSIAKFRGREAPTIFTKDGSMITLERTSTNWRVTITSDLGFDGGFFAYHKEEYLKANGERNVSFFATQTEIPFADLLAKDGASNMDCIITAGKSEPGKQNEMACFIEKRQKSTVKISGCNVDVIEYRTSSGPRGQQEEDFNTNWRTLYSPAAGMTFEWGYYAFQDGIYPQEPTVKIISISKVE